MNTYEIERELRERPELLEFMITVMECRPEIIEKGIKILELQKNPKYAELFEKITKITDERRIEALLCWSNQYQEEERLND